MSICNCPNSERALEKDGAKPQSENSGGSSEQYMGAEMAEGKFSYTKEKNKYFHLI